MKRQTKQQREAAQMEALKKRLRDVLIGAAAYTSNDEPLLANGISALLRWASEELKCHGIGALSVMEDERKRVLYWWNVVEYLSLDGAAEFFYRHGWRA